VDHTTRAGENAAVFVRLAREVAADLAVLRAPGSGAYVDDVVTRTPCPVVLVPLPDRVAADA
jgi:hypothetical protein